MIDIEYKVYDRVSKAIRNQLPALNVFVSGEYLRADSSFPAVTLMEMSNIVHSGSSTFSKLENMVDTMYEINVYSNKTAGKKSEAKSILAVIDNEMLAMGFSRNYCNPMPNVDNATIYRIVARYEQIMNGGL